ncbi:unnamed protein product [Effrenium voratum]|nr:unnamed protein product [Effrenium voratum]
MRLCKHACADTGQREHVHLAHVDCLRSGGLVSRRCCKELPAEVDFKVMLTFLEFYRAMVKFVNYRLYSELGLSYPPRRDAKIERSSAEVAALEVEMREAGRAQQLQSQQTDKDNAEVATGALADFGDESEAAEMQQKLAESGRMKTTFRGLRVFINREVPLRPAYFVLLCGGVAEVGWERGAAAGESAGQGSAFPVDGEAITHQIVDRPVGSFQVRPGREYVQPQWIFDSFNIGCTLPIAPYAPGRTPPPHLSPFVDDKAEGYVPHQREVLDRFAAEVSGTKESASKVETGDAAPAVGGAQFGEELLAESKGLWHSEYQQNKLKDAAALMEVDDKDMQPQRPSEAEEERLRAKALMPKKHKRLLQRIETAEAKKKEATKRLTKKAAAA